MDFQSEKSFGKLRLTAFQPYHQTLCILKHVKDVKDNLRHLRHASTYIRFVVWLESSKSQLSKTFFRIENPLSIKEVMSQNVCVCSFPIFDIFNIHSITALRCIWSIFDIFDIHSITALRCIWSIFDIFDIHSITAVSVLYLSSTSLTLLWSFVQYSMHSMLCISTPPTSNNVHWHILTCTLWCTHNR